MPFQQRHGFSHHPLACPIPATLWQSIQNRCKETGESVEHLVQTALSDYLQLDHATLFQVSTAGALVEGLYRGEVNIAALRDHGDFGIGTFNGLNGEMVALDGEFFQVRANGEVRKAHDENRVPYAMILRFPEGPTQTLGDCIDFDGLCKQLDHLRDSQNVFYALRIEGEFSTIVTRSVHMTPEGVPLVEAASQQSEFILHDVRGTLVGFWSPSYFKDVLVSGYHLHFISEDKTSGGHLLGCSSGHGLLAKVRRISDFRVSLPESAKFLHANLSRHASEDLERAEKKSQ